MKLNHIAAAALLFAATPALAEFAAIAYSPSTGAWGAGYRHATYDESVDLALQYCAGNSSQPADCQLVIWVENGCVALASDSARTQPWIYGAAYANGSTFTEAFTPAQQWAIQSCEQTHGVGCSIVTTYCSF